MICRRWLLNGRVQGVGLRYFIKANAQKLKLEGYVKNLSDGRVEVVVQGEEEKLDLLKSIILRGNGFSIVRYIEEEELPNGDYGEFHVEY